MIARLHPRLAELEQRRPLAYALGVVVAVDGMVAVGIFAMRVFG